MTLNPLQMSLDVAPDIHTCPSDADLLERAGVEISFETEGSLEDVADLFEE